MDRSKFRDTTRASDLKEQDKLINSLSGSKNDFAEFFKIEQGDNRFRIYPPHPSDNKESFVQPFQVWWLPYMKDKKDKEGNVIKNRNGEVEKEKSKKPIYDARIHSKVGKDIVDEYIKFLKNLLKAEEMSDTEITEAMTPIYGRYEAPKVQGIVGKPEWVMYADKIEGKSKTFGRLKIGKAVKNVVNKIIATEGASEPIGTESTNPFTDVDDGRALIIDYNGKANQAADFYTTSIDSSFDKKTKLAVLYPLSDAELAKFEKYPPLASIYKNSYTKKDFDLALAGLKMFDDDNGFGVFQYEEFLEICDSLKDVYPEKVDRDKEEIEGMFKGDKKPKEDTKRAVVEKEGDAYDDMNREELKTFIRANKLGIFVKPNMKDDEVREAIRAKAEAIGEEGDLPWEQKEAQEKKESVTSNATKAKAETTKAVEPDVKGKISSMRERLKNKSN